MPPDVAECLLGVGGRKLPPGREARLKTIEEFKPGRDYWGHLGQTSCSTGGLKELLTKASVPLAYEMLGLLKRCWGPGERRRAPAVTQESGTLQSSVSFVTRMQRLEPFPSQTQVPGSCIRHSFQVPSPVPDSGRRWLRDRRRQGCSRRFSSARVTGWLHATG